MDLIIPIILILLGLFVGRAREKSHFKNLNQRQMTLQHMLVTDLKNFPMARSDSSAEMLVCEVVIGTDYLKLFLAGLRNIFGGEVRSFQTLLIRARREAVLRLMEEASQKGYTALCNLRLNTADVGGSATTRPIPMAAILASATAYHLKDPEAA